MLTLGNTIRLGCISVLSLLLVLLSACGAPATPAPTPTTAAAAIQGNVVLLVSEDPEGLQAYKNIVAEFNRRYPAIKVTLTNVPDAGNFLTRLAADFAARTPPDLFVVNYRRFGQFAIKGVLEPVEEYMARSRMLKAADFYPIALEAFRFDGKQVCLPQNMSSLQIYYNKALFAAANVPLPRPGWTWDEFLQAARALTRDTNADGKPDQYGAGISPQLLRLAPLVWARGGDLVDNPDRPTKLLLDSGPALEAFQWFASLQTKERVIPSKADEAAEGSQARFQKGTLAMFFQSRVVTPELRQTIKGFEWDVAPLPRDKNAATVLHSDGYCLTRDSKNKDAAWAFMEFANAPDGQRLAVATGRTVPSLRAVAESPAFLNPGAPPSSNRIYLDAAPFIRRLPIMTTWSEVEDIVNQEIKRAFYGDASVEEAARTAMQNTKQYFDQNLKELGGR